MSLNPPLIPIPASITRPIIGLWIILVCRSIQPIRSLSPEVAGKPPQSWPGRHPVGPVWLACRSYSGKPDRGTDLFWVDQFHLYLTVLAAQWEVKDNISCVTSEKLPGDTAWLRSGIMTGTGS